VRGFARWWGTVGFVRTWALRSRGEIVFHRLDRTERVEDGELTRHVWTAGCGLVISDWANGRDHATATTYMLLAHAVKIGRPCSRCYPDGVA
jgi:hypothetical protein